MFDDKKVNQVYIKIIDDILYSCTFFKIEV